ncbi:hypothetical protein A3C67_00355 [Candidatus Nomurabacteria bacterium RIFCSPHIGHO2_02_FULL_42_19]|uniref:DoxX family protein n=1 Tax=Candidatus Nomurabacteria bacterium RIFCSPHIGHO2_02_FULL_42_19 TaxID=1801756 RepID=A0A1F6W3M6_9BACT|nr:MAG: hypothetical protein A3C67_00355 [Candidatus Nomurabacteria bacterium RIFCSPHIGHO2_02_FULL_42_19]
MQNFNQKIENWDEVLVSWAGRIAVPFARFAIFAVYVYFGAIKIFSANGAANPLIIALLNKTMPTVAPEPFLIAFGVLEIIIGLIFITPSLTRLGLFLLAFHFITTILPLFILPELTWQGLGIPTLEGQYILKNILIVSLAVIILASLPVLKESKANV